MKVMAVSALLLASSAAYLRSAPLALLLLAGILGWVAFGATVVATDLGSSTPQPRGGGMQSMAAQLEGLVLQLPYVFAGLLVIGALVGCGMAAEKLFKKR